MRRLYSSIAAALLVAPVIASAQQMDETVKKVADGGIKVPGWIGQLDPGAKETVNDAKLTMNGKNFHVMTGPAITYVNPANKASGDYTVKATFTEKEYMALNDHPHPYGIVIGGNDMGTPNATYLYCTAYGNGTFIMRGFGPAAFQLGGRRATPNEAVHKAAGKGSPVTQDIAMTVKGDSVSCAINGTKVASYPKSEVVGPGKLKSLDGLYGFRFAHNTEGEVAGLTVSKP
jgi:hypothetical protein